MGVILFLLRRRRLYRSLLAPRHFVELADVVARLRREAVGAAARQPASAEQEAPIIGAATSAGLAISYSITPTDDIYAHHVALSLPGRPTTHGLADLMAYYVVERLGVARDAVRLGSTRSTVHHLIFELTEAEHRAAVDRPIAPPSEEELQRVLRAYETRRIPCHPMESNAAE
ncbi:MAG: hypothetical protein ACREMV_01635 [Gemmatimonadales bacterium]